MIIVMPLTYSITNGIGAAFVTYAFLRVVSGRPRDPPLLWVVTGAFVVYFAMPLIEALV